MIGHVKRWDYDYEYEVAFLLRKEVGLWFCWLGLVLVLKYYVHQDASKVLVKNKYCGIV